VNGYDGDPRYERFQLIVNGPALFNAIAAGVELGIFRMLSHHGHATLEELREHTGLGAHQIRILMFALCVTELIVKRDGKYSNAALAEDFFASDAPDSWSNIVLGWQRVYYPAFAHMTEALRRGANTALDDYPGTEGTLYERLALNPGLERIFHDAMAAFTLRSLPGLLDNVDLSSIRRLLDIGGGDGTTARAVARRFPDVEVTVFDLPSVASLAAVSAAASSGGNVTIDSGNFLRDPFPKGFDAVLFSHVLEVFNGEQIEDILRRAYESLPRGGRVFVYGFNASADEVSGPLGARLTLYLNILATGQGMSYPAADYERWLSNAGFQDVHTKSGLPYEHGLTAARKA
jgi:SAM-dependent methyltransferase